MQTSSTENSPIRYGFLVVENYSMIAISSAIEPLRMANRISDKTLYEWFLVTLDGNPVPASNGLIINPDFAVADVSSLNALFVCSGLDAANSFSKQLKNVLRRKASQKIPLGALCTGSYLLAKSGLLDGYQCTIHWENIASMREEFPQIRFSEELFEIDRDRYTCAGGSAPLDLMLKLIANTHGNQIAIDISEMFLCDRIRDKKDRQRIPLQIQLGANQTILIEAVTLMETNIEEPISLEELSHYVGISRRHLERLFRKYLNCVPTRYYMDLRLKRARQLLLQTNKSIIEVALACGFVSAPHFSKCYRDFYGLPPRQERQQKLVIPATNKTS